MNSALYKYVLLLLCYEKGEVIPVHIITERFDNHVNLLFISYEKKSNYCWIKDINKLFNDQHPTLKDIISVLTVFTDLLKKLY